MKAPEKIYIDDFGSEFSQDWHTEHSYEKDIEYTRTDVLIEKAREWLRTNLSNYFDDTRETNLDSAVDFIADSLQEEPISDDLEEACQQLAEKARIHKAKIISPFFSQTDYIQGVKDGVKWQKERL